MSLRVGLTGGLGSGKSTVAGIFAKLGAEVLSADEIGRGLMQPGEAVCQAIVDRFGPEVVKPDGSLNRPALARLAFAEGRVEELNALVHPATIARQGELAEEIFARNPEAVVVVESALIFETTYGGGWRERFDRMVLVTAPEELKVARFVARAGGGDVPGLEAEARRRLAQMSPDEEKVGRVDFVVSNTGSLEELRKQAEAVWAALRRDASEEERRVNMSEPEGITNHPASTETAEDAKLKDAPAVKQGNDGTPKIDTRDLPKGMAEKVETVQVSTMTVKE